MITHLLHYGNSSNLPYISCQNQLTLSGFKFEYNEKQELRHLNIIFNNPYESAEFSSILAIDSNINDAEEIISRPDFTRSRVILSDTNALTIRLIDVIGTSLIELVPLCKNENPSQPIYLYFELILTAKQYQSSRYFVGNRNDDRSDYMGPTYISYYNLDNQGSDKIEADQQIPHVKYHSSFFKVSIDTSDEMQEGEEEEILVTSTGRPDIPITDTGTNPKPLHIAMVAGGSFDGSKQVLTSAWKHFYNHTRSNNASDQVKFTLVWICAEELSSDGICEHIDPTVKHLLNKSPHVVVIYFPSIDISLVAYDEKYVIIYI